MNLNQLAYLFWGPLPVVRFVQGRQWSCLEMCPINLYWWDVWTAAELHFFWTTIWGSKCLGVLTKKKTWFSISTIWRSKWWPVFTKKNTEIQSRTYQGDFIKFCITEYFNYFSQRTWFRVRAPFVFYATPGIRVPGSKVPSHQNGWFCRSSSARSWSILGPPSFLLLLVFTDTHTQRGFGPVKLGFTLWNEGRANMNN